MGIKHESVGIGRIERFVADYHNEHSKEAPKVPEKNGHRVAVVGSGPSGLKPDRPYSVIQKIAAHKAVIAQIFSLR
jgi:NADPH-dependent glutamate synthase beta subunit-like oxidoreductase